MDYEEKLDAQLAEIKKMLLAKHYSYGSDNLKTFGEFGILVRVSDKIARLKHLLDTGSDSVVGEKKKDTWMDLAGYAIQALVLFSCVGENK